MPVEVPTKTTPVTKQQALAALQAAWGPLSRDLAASLLSLVWIETGGGNLKNFNPGNISAGPQYAGMVWRPPWYPEPDANTPQRIADLHRAMLNKTAPSAFRAYSTLEQGFADFVAQLRHTFPEVVAAAEHGTPDQFREALSQKYSHDYRNPQATATFTKLRESFAPVVAHLPKGAVSWVHVVEVGAGVAALGAAYFGRAALKALWGRLFG